MKQIATFGTSVLALLVFALVGRSALADGVMISRVELGKAADVVSSPKQEAVLIPDGETVTVILRTHFERGPGEVAWLVPVPNEPTHIAQRSDDIFAELDAATTPRFYTESYHGIHGFGCSVAGPIREPLAPGVRHEASGQP